jgi:hypothetical protein
MSFRDNSSFGKRQEFTAIAELLRRGFDVYLTLVDDQGIDCIIRRDEHTYVDIQIKARSRRAKHWATFAAMEFTPRRNLFFIFYTERGFSESADIPNIWVMSSKDVAARSHQNVQGRNAGRRTLVLPKTAGGAKGKVFARFLGDAGFEALRNFRSGRS